MPDTTPHDAANWFEIPATNLDRAAAFYEALLATKLHRGVYGDPMAVFPSEPKGVGGALVLRPKHEPATAGALVYLNADGVLDEALARTEQLGGAILVPATPVPGGFGMFACIRDCEGNHVGLHAH